MSEKNERRPSNEKFREKTEEIVDYIQPGKEHQQLLW